MPTVKRKLGEKLLELRGEKSLYEVEKAAKVPRGNLYNYENGKHLPTERVLKQLADFYQFPYRELRKLYFDDYFPEGSEDREILTELLAPD